MRRDIILITLMAAVLVFASVPVAMPIRADSDPPPPYGIGQLLATFPVDLNQCWERDTGSSDLLYNPCGNPKGPRKSVGELWPILSATFEFSLPSEGWILLDVEWILDANYPGSFSYEVDKFDENSGQWSKVGVPRVYSEKKDGQYVRAPVPSNFWDGFQLDSNGNLSGPIDMGRPMPSGKYRIVASEYFYDTTPVYYTQAYWPSKGTINVIFIPQKTEVPGTAPLDYSKGVEISYPDNTKRNKFSWPTDWPSGTEPIEFKFTDRDSFVFLPGGYIRSDQTGSVTIDKDSITLDKKVSDIPLQFSDMGAEVVIQQGRIEVIPYLHAPGEVLLAGGWDETAEKFIEEKAKELPYIIWENKGQIALSQAGGTFIKLTTGIPGWILTKPAKYGARLLGANWDHILKAIAKGEEETKKAGCPYGWNLSTATGHCLVKSECFIRTLDDGTTTIYVCEGDVEFSDVHDNKTVHINRGYTSTCKVGGLPSDPVPFDQDEVEKLWKTGVVTPTPTGPALIAESRTVTPGGTVQVPIRLQKAENIGSMNFVLTYDPSVLRVTRVDKGSLLSNVMFVPNYKEPPVILFGFATKDGVSGDGSVAYIEFEAVGSEGSSSPLTLSEVAPKDTSGQTPSLSTQKGMVTIGEKNPGDFTGDGKLTEKDALATLQMSVKLRVEDLILDMDKDGKVTADDARQILKQAVKGR